jgi:DNA repair protein RecO
MGIEKTSAVVLSLMPYRESSFIAILYSNTHGLIHGVAKGIRRHAKGVAPLERGFLVDLLVYVKGNRDLHTLADIQISEYYPRIRNNLQKAALRDTAFELLLRSVTLSDSHPELYGFLAVFLSSLQSVSGREESFMLLWRFYYGVAQLLGFSPRFDHCFSCGSAGILDNGGYLVIEKGAICCNTCAVDTSSSNTFIDAFILQRFTGDIAGLRSISPGELLRLTRIAVSYCRFHLDIGHDFKTVEFLEQMMQ